MTVLVGILCDDGVVIGSDSAISMGSGLDRTIEHASGAMKVHVGPGTLITAITGSVGLAQRYLNVLNSMHAGNKLGQLDPIKQCTDIAHNVIDNFRTTISALQHQPQHGWGFGCLLGMVVQNKPELFEFDPLQFHPERKGDRDRSGKDRGPRFVTMGSGQSLADPFLAFIADIFWRGETPKLADAKLALGWTLDHAIQFNTGGVGGSMQMAAIRKDVSVWKAELVDTSELKEQIEDLKKYIGQYKDQIVEKTHVAAKSPTPILPVPPKIT